MLRALASCCARRVPPRARGTRRVVARLQTARRPTAWRPPFTLPSLSSISRRREFPRRAAGSRRGAMRTSPSSSNYGQTERHSRPRRRRLQSQARSPPSFVPSDCISTLPRRPQARPANAATRSLEGLRRRRGGQSSRWLWRTEWMMSCDATWPTRRRGSRRGKASRGMSYAPS